MNRAATRIAREVAGEGDVLVAGNLSCAWAYGPDDPATHRRTRELFDRQLAVMTEEGADFVIAETFSWLGEAMIAAEALAATGLPAMVTMGPDNDPNSFEGYSPGEQAKRLADAGVDIVGSCCGSVAAHVREMAKALGKVSTQEREWRAAGDRPKSGYELHRMGRA